MATVTVIIPTFNRQHLIGQAVESVLAQTYTDFELLVVDDGSTDKTKQALQSWKSKIRYVKKVNGGPSSARNFGVRYARTLWVAFLDSDDLWEPEFLQTVVNGLSTRSDLGLVATGHLVVPDGLTRPRMRQPRLEGDLYPLLFQNNFITTSGVLVKRECFEVVGMFNEELDQAEDYDMWLRIAHSYSMMFLNRPLCRVLKHLNNASRHELRHRFCVKHVIEANYDPDRISTEIHRLRQSRIWVSLGRAYLHQLQRRHAHQCFQEAINLTPTRVRPWWYFLQTWL